VRWGDTNTISAVCPTILTEALVAAEPEVVQAAVDHGALVPVDAADFALLLHRRRSLVVVSAAALAARLSLHPHSTPLELQNAILLAIQFVMILMQTALPFATMRT
jgi:hypothetical protein